MCFVADPMKRATFSDIVEELEQELYDAEKQEYNKKFNNNGRTRIILPGEDPNDPNRVLIPGLHDANNNNRMFPNNNNNRMNMNRYPSPYNPAQYDPRCRNGQWMNQTISAGSCSLCSRSRYNPRI